MKSPQISWMTLEQLALGELSPSETERVRAAIDQDGELAARWESITTDDRQWRFTPPLVEVRRPWYGALLDHWLRPLVACGAMAAAALAVVTFGGTPPESIDGVSIRGALPVTLGLVRRGEFVNAEPVGYTPDHRFKVVVSCAVEDPVWWRVFLFDDDGVSTALEASEPLNCGNGITLPGAFRIESSVPARVCVSLDHEPLGDTADFNETDSRCISLTPMP